MKGLMHLASVLLEKEDIDDLPGLDDRNYDEFADWVKRSAILRFKGFDGAGEVEDFWRNMLINQAREDARGLLH